MEKEQILEERKEKIFEFLKNPRTWVIGLLIIALFLGVSIRSRPMEIRPETGKPGLWDITTDTWTLGPDLDPWLFLRYAETIVEDGGLPKIDHMRYTPFGYEVAKETRLLPYMIAGTYYLINIFTEANIEYAGVVFPVIMFALTILSFFLFVREIFVSKSKKSKMYANIISLISVFFMIVMPVFLSRTIAGIPEKESVGFFFMFLSFYLFLKAWKSADIKSASIFAIFAGISTALMGLVWGGVVYVFVTIALSALIGFILNTVRKKEFTVYTLWIVFSWGLMLFFSQRFTLKGLLTSLNTGLAFLVFFIMAMHFLIWKTNLKNIRFLQKSKLPKNILSIIIAVIILFIGLSLIAGPSFIIEKAKSLNQMFFKPITGRWSQTVAENKQPYFSGWGQNFGPFLNGIPILFWIFFIGSVVLFKKMLNKIKKKDSWILTFFYILAFFGLVFSRYSGSHTLNGENFISKFIYYGSGLLLIGGLIYYYIKYYKTGDRSFEKINYNYIFLFVLFLLTLFTARSAVRLIMVLAPVAVIFIGYLIIESIDSFRKTEKADPTKMAKGIFIILIVILSMYSFWIFYKSVNGQAYYFVPSAYNNQWQKAMSWVRTNTPEESTVFAHWWDYGYWVQSIGRRASVLDGSNSIKYWNYLMGRYVLTGDNEKDALDFLYSHNATHLLIDSSDLGKYGAFSIIGSDENYDRYSGGPPTLILNNKQVKETANSTLKLYDMPSRGGSSVFPLYEDLIYEDNGTSVFLPAGASGFAGVFVEIEKEGNEGTFLQAKGLYIYKGQQYTIPLRYLYYNGVLMDFGKGVEGVARIIPSVGLSGNQLITDEQGAMIYISPRITRGLLGQMYLLDNAFNNFPNIKEEYVEDDLVVASLKENGLNIGHFVYYQGLRAPLKIWKIDYTGNEEVKEEYLDRDYTKYLSWEL